MSTTGYRLAAHTLAEPLVNGWPAWWLPVAPVPSSLHLRNYQVPLLEAYLQDPAFHEQAAQDPLLSGRSFVNVPARRAGEVQALLERTLREQRDRIELAAAVEDFDALLLREAHGQALAPFYERIPEPLKPMVELVYDYHNRPFVRLIEGVTYRTRYYKPELQCVRLLCLEADAARAPVYTSPSLRRAGDIEIDGPFADERLDRLFALDLEPQPLAAIRALLGSAVGRDEDLLRILSAAPLPPRPPSDGAALRVRYVGHACVLIEWKGMAILTDPVVAPRPVVDGAARVSFEDLPPRIDYALVTHSHADHLAFDTLLRLRHRIDRLVVPRANGLVLGDYSPRLMFRTLGFRQVDEVDAYEALPLPDGEIIATPFLGEHGDIGLAKCCFVVRAGTEQMLFAADSTCLNESMYRDVRQSLGSIGTVFMNTETEGAPLTWTNEALFPRRRDRKLEKDRRCRGSNAEEGLRLLATVGAKRLYNYAMGLEPWLQHIIGPPSTMEAPRMEASEQLLAAARARGVAAERLCGPRAIRVETS